MWHYEKRLIRPIKVQRPDPAAASVIISQLGGPHGELGAATRYLSQRYSMPYGEIAGILTDVGTEEPKWRKKLPRQYLRRRSFSHIG